ncbi:MAG: efflux RND transporter periplasmic adaptor subunit [Hyphomicrobiaceae bacterium]
MISGRVVDLAAEAPFDASIAAGLDSTRGIANGNAVRGVLRSVETASISAEINARLVYLPQREGDAIVKGQPIVKFDCTRIVAELAAAEATYQRLLLVYETEQKLEGYEAAGSLSVEQARYDMLKAEAERQVLEARKASCTILAPFDGRVVEKVAQVHEMAEPNQPILKIVNDSRIELVMMIPSSWLRRLPAGTRFTLHVDELARNFPAHVVQSTGVIDPVSQSARLIGELDDASSDVLPGMSGTVYFEADVSMR